MISESVTAKISQKKPTDFPVTKKYADNLDRSKFVDETLFLKPHDPLDKSSNADVPDFLPVIKRKF